MSDEKLSVRTSKSPYIPDEYFREHRKASEYKLAIQLWEKLNTDEYYTIRIKRETPEAFYLSLPTEYGEPVPQDYTTTVYIGKVQPTYLELKSPKKLNWKERLHVLFTGEVPLVLRKK